jgi:division/cell wall cluster transcriptional repressor MraZ
MEQPVFLNNQLVVVDSKHRVAIPERFIKVLKAAFPDNCEEIGVRATPDRSVKVMPIPLFEKELESWRHLDERVSEERTILNIMTATADRLALDKQNRIRLSPMLCEFCNLSRDAIIVGNMDYMQIYDLGIWNEKLREGMQSFDQALNNVAMRTKGSNGAQGSGESGATGHHGP